MGGILGQGGGIREGSKNGHFYSEKFYHVYFSGIILWSIYSGIV
jgi:hypothetical protein